MLGIAISKRRFVRLGLASVAAAAVSAAMASSAPAATLTLSGSAPNQTLSYVAATNKTNDLTVSLAAGSYTFTETGTTDNITTAVPGCSGSGTGSVSCPAANVAMLSIDGGNQSDVLTVNAATPTTFASGAGSDTMNGGSGADVFETGTSTDGGDTINGGAGIDTVDYSTRGGKIDVDLSTPGADDGQGSENDNISATDVENVVGGSNVNGDTLIGNGLANVLTGGPGPDTLTGNDGDDTFPQGSSNDGGDTISGGAGKDHVDYSQRTTAVIVNLAAGGANDGQSGEADNISTSDVENVSGSSQGDTLTGNSLDNTFIGGLGGDTMNGADGNDSFNSVTTGADGADTMSGGNGSDLAVYILRTAAIRVDVNTAGGDGQGCPGFACENDSVGGDIESVFGGSGGDTLIGDSSDDVFVGFGGNDTIEGRGGADAIFDAVFLPGGGNNTFKGGDGVDTLTGGPGDDTLQGGNGIDALDGEGGVNTADFTDQAAGVTVDLAAGSGGPAGELDALNDIQHVATGSGGDAIVGDGSNNVLRGGGGDDTIEGRGGEDSLQGGAGDDSIDGGSGTDTVDYLDRTATEGITVDLGAGEGGGPVGTTTDSDELIGIENATGGEGNDTLAGDGQNNVLRGSGGSDTVDYSGRSSSVTVDLAAGTATDGSEADTLQTIENASGGSGADTLLGDGGANVLRGNGGDDQIDGRAGLDVLDLGHHTVDLVVDLTQSSVTAAGETDSYTAIEGATGGSGNDQLLGNSGPNVLRGGLGDDDIDGRAGDDTLQGDDGNDMLRAGSAADGADRLLGGDGLVPSVRDGIDTADYSQRTGDLLIDMKSVDGDQLDGENCPGPSCEGDFVAPIDVENVWAGSGDDTVIGTPNGNVLRGNGGSDTLDGFDADDTLDGGGPDGLSDTLIGGLGTDKVDYSNRTAPVAVDLGSTGPVSGLGGETSEDDVISEVEDVTGGSDDDVLRGNDETINVLRGGDGNDTLDGRGRGDLLFGQAGARDVVDYSDRTEPVTARADGVAISGEQGEADIIGVDVEDLTGGEGDDHLDGRSNDNVLTGNGGDDTLSGRDGSDLLRGGEGSDDLLGGRGLDTLEGQEDGDILQGGEADDVLDGGQGDDFGDYSERTVAVSADLASTGGAAGESDGFVSVEGLIGGTSDDSLRGDAGDNLIVGGEGNDHLSGGPAGNDLLTGDYGDDTFDAESSANGPDAAVGGEGSDTADYSKRAAPVAVSLDDNANDGAAGEQDDIDGSVEAVIGGSGADQLSGSGASNELSGGAGNDSIAGGAGADTLNGGSGDDALAGDGGDDTLDASAGNDSLSGGEGADTMRGASGDDALEGGGGPDLLIGGEGSDFVDYSSRVADQAVSLDDAADDGLAGEGDNARSDIERLATGAGNDTVNVVNGVANAVDCGGGRDIVDGRDPFDSLAASCEPTVCLTCLDLVISDKPITISRSGVASVGLSCRAPRACNGTLSLTLADGRASASKKGKKKKKRKQKVRIQSIGRSPFVLNPGTTGTVKVKVSSATRNALLKVKRPKVKIGVSLQGTAGSTSRSVALKVTRPVKAKKRGGKR